jgi:2-polyprenyl-3-methyl-5-hydroxy-6-metoxy-1,4-benzoquinol methylase
MHKKSCKLFHILKKIHHPCAFFDFGMGHGRWALLAKGFECQSYGTELTDELIEHAKSNGINVISWDEIPQYSFDFINTEQVFEHISKPLQTLHHLKKSLKDEGILKISVPPANDIDRRLKIMDWESPKYSRNSLNAVAQQLTVSEDLLFLRWLQQPECKKY